METTSENLKDQNANSWSPGPVDNALIPKAQRTLQKRGQEDYKSQRIMGFAVSPGMSKTTPIKSTDMTL